MEKSEKNLTERILKYYFNGKLQAKYNIQKRRGEQNYHPSAVDYSGVNGGETHNISDEIAQFVEQKDQSGQIASFLQMFIQDIKDIMNIIKDNEDNEDYKLLKWSYIRKPKHTDEDIAGKLNKSVWAVREKREELLEDIYEMLNIDYYLDNPLEDIAEYFEGLLGGE